ncbi:MAG: DNA alkylation repair protein [Patescibacteria group bacterium]
MKTSEVKRELLKRANPIKAKLLSGFFKTGKGEYGEGDKFLGIMVPVQRIIAKKFKDLPLNEVRKLINDQYHEVRLTGLLILIYKIKRANEVTHKTVTDFYLSNTKQINNWDLVDVTARDIVGGYLYDFNKDRKILYKLARSKNLWERRIATISTFYFIGKNDFSDSIRIAEILLTDNHDLIHKAVGWMLREMGKRDKKELIKFLKKHAREMPRTMLRYSIERLNLREKEKYMRIRNPQGRPA